MAWRRPGDKPLSEPMTVSLLTHTCVTRPQWVKSVTVIWLNVWVPFWWPQYWPPGQHVLFIIRSCKLLGLSFANMIVLNKFCWMISQHRFRWWHGLDETMSHCLCQWGVLVMPVSVTRGTQVHEWGRHLFVWCVCVCVCAGAWRMLVRIEFSLVCYK